MLRTLLSVYELGVSFLHLNGYYPLDSFPFVRVYVTLYFCNVGQSVRLETGSRVGG